MADADLPHDPYRELFERSADAILIIDGDRFVDCNQATVEMLRCAHKVEVLQTHPSQLSPPVQPDGRDSFEKANAMIAQAFARGSHRFEWMHRRADGEVFPVEVLLTAVPRGEGFILHCVWRDITERKQLEEQLRIAARMEALGRLAGGVAHDFNNVLAVIVGHAEVLERHLEADAVGAGHARRITHAGQRGAALVRQLLAFARRREARQEVIDVGTAATDLADALRRLVGAGVRLEVDVGPGTHSVRVGEGQVEQVLLHLAGNARDAMPDGGRLRFTVGRRHLAGEEGLLDGDYVELCAEDEGVGMDEATVRRAFDPFFTTKGAGVGTGLGLATVLGIARQAGGTATVRSTLGVGTAIRVLLPAEDAGELAEGGTEPVLARTPRGVVLVVEDEPLVAEVVRLLLEAQGHEVAHAADGAEGLAAWRAGRGRFDLVLSDVVMPRMGGVELLRAMRGEGWAGPVVLMSGWADGALAEPVADPAVRTLAKPFKSQELLAAVGWALAHPPRR